MATKYPVHRIFLTSGKVSHILESGVRFDGESSSLCGLWSDKWRGEDKQDAIKAKERPLCNNCTHIVMSRKYTLVEPVETLPDIPPSPVEDAAAEKSLLEEEIDRTLTEMRADLVRMRLIHGFTRREVADRIGVLPKHVRRFEEGISNPQVSFLRRYCLAIGVVLKFEVLHVVE